MTRAAKVYLVGMMGSGKTTVGALLAKRLGWPFFDLDAEVERTAGKSVGAIFAADGEGAFRAIEARGALRLAALEEPAVVALGGGAVLDPGTCAALRASGDVFWLRAPPETLDARLGEAKDRPLLSGLDGGARLARLAATLRARESLYQAVAHEVVDTAGWTPAEVVREVAEILGRVRAIRVDLGERGYDVVVKAGGPGRLGDRLDRLGLGGRRLAIVTDATVARDYLAPVREALGGVGEPVVSILEPGEGSKQLLEVGVLHETWAKAGLDRGACVVALGGGVVTDVAGFAAAIFLRGVPWVAVPTTLLGMVDAAIGGKTGVNLPGAKNLAGAFHQPSLVVCDLRVLATLPPREVRSGFGEVLKYGLIGPRELFELIDRHVDALAAPGGLGRHVAHAAGLIARCIEVKAGVVARDERETAGERKVLNFGHTFGHAVEAASGFSIPHGDCVVLGMRAALYLSVEAGLLPFDEARLLARFLAKTGVPPLPGSVHEAEILGALARDKKFAAGKRLFVLLATQGAPRVDVEVPEAYLRPAIHVMRGAREVA